MESSRNVIHERDAGLQQLHQQISEAEQQLHQSQQQVENLTQNNSSLATEKDQLEARVASLDAHVSEIDAGKQQTQSELDAAKQTIAEREDAIQQLQQQLGDAEAAQGESQTRISSLTTILDAVAGEKAQLEGRIVSLDSHFREIDQQIQQVRGQLTAAQQTIADRDAAVAQLKQQLDDADASQNESSYQIEELTASVKTLSEEKSQLEESANSLGMQLKQIDQQNQEAQSELMNAQQTISQRDATVRTLQQQVDESEAARGEFTLRMENLKSEIDRLSSEVRDKAELEAANAELADQKQKLEREIAVIQESLADQEAKSKAVEDELSREKEELQASLDLWEARESTASSDLENTNVQLQQMAEELRGQLDATNAKYRELEERSTETEVSLGEAIDQANRNIVHLQQVRDEEAARAVELQNENASLKQRLDSSQLQEQETKTQLEQFAAAQSSQAENDVFEESVEVESSLREELTNQKRYGKRLHAAVNQLQTQIAMMDDERKKAVEERNELTAELEQLRQTQDAVQQNAPETGGDIAQVAALDAAERELQDLKRRLARLNEEKEQADLSCFAAQTQASELTQQLDDLIDARNTLTRERDEFKLQIDSLEGRTAASTDPESDEEKNELLRQLKESREEVDRLLSKTNDLSRLQIEFEELDRQQAQLTQERDQALHELKEARENAEPQENPQLEAQIVALTEQIQDSKLQVDQLNSVCLRFQGEAESAKREAEDRQTQLSAMQDQLQQMESSQTSLEGEIAQYKTRCSVAEQQLADATSQRDQEDTASTNEAQALRSELQQTKALLDQVNVQRTQMQTAAENAEATIAELKESLETAKSELASQAEAQEESSQQDNSKFEEDLKQRYEELKRLREQLDGTTSNLESLTEQMARRDAEIRQLQNEKVDLVNTIRNVRSVDQTEQLGVELMDARNTISTQRQQQEAAESQVRQLQNELAQLKSGYAQLESNKAEADEEQELMAVELRQLRVQEEELRNQLEVQSQRDLANNDAEELKQKLQEAEAKAAETREELYTLSESGNAWRRERTELLNTVERLEHEKAELNRMASGDDQVDVHDIVQRNDQLADELDKTRSELEQRTEKLAEVAASLSDARRDLTSLRSEIKEQKAVLRNVSNGNDQPTTPKAPKKKTPARQINKKPAVSKSGGKKKQDDAWEDHPEFGKVYASKPARIDNLKKINGLGPKFEQKLNELGIYQYAQIAKWSKKVIRAISDETGAGDRITRTEWVKQAKELR